MTTDFRIRAAEVLRIEAAAVEQLQQYLNADFNLACQLIFDSKGKTIVSGMGKSGHIGSKIAATLASTGTPAFFFKTGDARQCDLGML